MRGHAERSRFEELEHEVIALRVLARSLWRALRARTALEARDLFQGEGGMRVADAVFDAAQTVWERQRITIVPCRTILDNANRTMWSGPGQPEMYLGTWPGGDTRNLTRDQVLMMAGMDPEANPPSDDDGGMWF